MTKRCAITTIAFIALFHAAGCDGNIIDLDRTLYSNVTPVTGQVSYTEARIPCADNNPLRNLYFGDLHAHTRRSFDAWSYDVRVSPDEAWRFARGEAVRLPPLDDNGVGTRVARLHRPLDFAALTDHQEFIAEVQMCTVAGSPGYDTDFCARYRQGGEEMAVRFGYMLTRDEPVRFAEICGDKGETCRTVAANAWHDIVRAAETASDNGPDCRFTAFVAYEYTTSMPALANHHRNVIFRNAEVPVLPPSYFEEQTPLSLWEALEEDCLLASGRCDVIVVPHNTNWSNGNMFVPGNRHLPIEEQIAAVTLRAEMEPLLEIMQHKGDMEATNGFSGTTRDPLADFEKIRGAGFDDCGDGTGFMGIAGQGCVSRYDFARGITTLGLAEQARLGINPYRLGFIGSTDTHNGTPGAVEEDNYPGHVGLADDTPAKRLGRGTDTHDVQAYNPGGLTGAWAVENSRDALFEAFRRREVFATSGPRISARLFGGWSLPADMCQREDFARIGYDRGVPMGGVLPGAIIGDTRPSFAVMAAREPDADERRGTKLQRIQIIKGWIDEQGREREKIYEIAGNSHNGATVDRNTCAPVGTGYDTLCAVWTDPGFDPALPAFYYARVVENPVCSWRQRDCNTFASDAPNRPAACDTLSEHRMVIQERAVTSPVHYSPD